MFSFNNNNNNNNLKDLTHIPSISTMQILLFTEFFVLSLILVAAILHWSIRFVSLIVLRCGAVCRNYADLKMMNRLSVLLAVVTL